MERRTIAGILLALTLSLGLLGSALAHAKLASSDPKDGAKLDKPPSKITLIFSEEIDDKQSGFTVSDANGTTVGRGKLDTNDLDHKTLSGTLDAGAGDGAYTVNWVAVTTDDNAKTEGSISFTVGVAQAQPTATLKPTVQATTTAQPTAAPRPTTAAQPTITPSNLPNTSNGAENNGGWLLGLVGIALLIGALIVWRVQSRERH